MRARFVTVGRCDRGERAAPQIRHGESVVQPLDAAWVLLDGRPVMNFASSNYLGLSHAPRTTVHCDQPLALSLPRGIAVEECTLELERALARLVEQPAALIGPSTLHILTDLVRVLAGSRGSVLLDKRCYSLSVSAAATAKGTGARIGSFRHFDPDALRRRLARLPAGPRVVLCDGVAMPGSVAPLRPLAEAAEHAGATLVVDDTQGIGLLGKGPWPGVPYGSGGGGTARHQNAQSPRLVIVASLAKAFGIPIAFVAGNTDVVERIRRRADFLWTSSPPDRASVRAALDALEQNEHVGTRLRQELAEAVEDLASEGGTTGRGLFPVQSWYFDSPRLAERVHAALLKRNVWTILSLHPVEGGARAAIRFLVTAAHAGAVMARALATVRHVQAKVVRW